jgi:hypothetical protein
MNPLIKLPRGVKRGIKVMRIRVHLNENQTLGSIKFVGNKRNGFYVIPIYEPDKERMVEALRIVLAIKPNRAAL